MAQENIDDWFESLKDLAKAEKELKIIQYVKICILLEGQGESRVLYTYDIPREMERRWVWVIHWRQAKFICKYPRYRVSLTFYYYDKKSGLYYGADSCLRQLAARKAQITKVENRIAKYTSYEKSNNLFFNEKTDEILIKTYAKLEQKKQNFLKCQEIIIEKIKQLGDPDKRWELVSA